MRRTPVLLIALAWWLGPARAAPVRYSCEDGTGLVVTFSKPNASPGTADVLFATSEHRVHLFQTLSADGARYVNGTTQFWIKGEGATLTQEGATIHCRASAR